MSAHAHSEVTHDASGRPIQDRDTPDGTTPYEDSEPEVGDQGAGDSPKAGRVMRRCYTIGDLADCYMEMRHGQIVIRSINWSEVSDHVRLKMQADAVADALLRMESDADILSGDAFPDRKAPELRFGGAQKPRVPRLDGRSHGRVTMTVKAIATVLANLWVIEKPEFNGNWDHAYAAGEVYALGLRPDQRLRVRKLNSDVEIEFLKQRKSQSIVDILAERDPTEDDDEDQQAAD